ncbi:hypothetical protein ACS15_5245 [Ralstonia insidiosa]|uniref:Transposase n=1 Tax=Ralstonia insidiosa TaxID=190721 RepID=A0AAC9BN08_9RALS|nr:hypothetical protein ACS15_5245 [Ralstonia insidiosa]
MLYGFWRRATSLRTKTDRLNRQTAMARLSLEGVRLLSHVIHAC